MPLRLRLYRRQRDQGAHATTDLKSGTLKSITAAPGDIALARGMTQLAPDTGLAREAPCRSLSPNGNPSLSALLKVTHALGARLTAISA